MFCPNCETKHAADGSRCSECGATLVERLDRTSGGAPASKHGASGTADRPELLWTGTEPGVARAIANALDKAGIACHTRKGEAGRTTGSGNLVYAIFTPARNHEAAHAALKEVQGEAECAETPASD